MINLTKWMVAPALAAAFLFAGDTQTAQAQHGFHLSIGGGASSCGGGGFYNSGYRGYSSNYGYRSVPSFGYSSHYRAPRYHDTSHFDYHPTQVRRHRNHYDVIPGHYDYHRTGHYHH